MRQVPVQHGEADLRRVGLARELRLGHEARADRDAIAAAGEFARSFQTSNECAWPASNSFGIDAHDLGRDPGEMPALGAVAGAAGDHALEVAVERDGVAVVPHLPAQPLRDMEVSSKNSSERFGGDHHFNGPIWASG